ncbi:hypothetical protein MPH_05766 [Macrophomina phaseolina MS6]|uniref:Uncharacterized protein n=1 Tax=Macrophomina phaseolina (strain MS6) TaxID=1126212 RepID=K2R432_MACPH|nr:hypothetical protein MPH_05766 [Macrophomina phaseolina MS6]
MDSYSYGSKKTPAAYYTPASSSRYYASSAATASSMKPTRGYGSKQGSPVITHGGDGPKDPPTRDNTGYWS